MYEEWRVVFTLDDSAPRGAGTYRGTIESERNARLRLAEVRRSKSHVESWLERSLGWERVEEAHGND